MFTFLLIIQALIAALLVTVILMQRSEGGGLTSSGSPSGLMSARGAADFLTRATSILATLFIAMSILLAVLAATRSTTTIDSSLQRAPVSTTGAPEAGVPVADPGNAAAPAAEKAPEAAAPANGAVPMAQ